MTEGSEAYLKTYKYKVTTKIYTHQSFMSFVTLYTEQHKIYRIKYNMNHNDQVAYNTHLMLHFGYDYLGTFQGRTSNRLHSTPPQWESRTAPSNIVSPSPVRADTLQVQTQDSG